MRVLLHEREQDVGESAVRGAVEQIPEPLSPNDWTRLRRGKELLRRTMESVASSPEELASTLDGIERWAREIHELAG